MCRSIGDKLRQAFGLTGLGTILWRQGDSPGPENVRKRLSLSIGTLAITTAQRFC